MVDNLFGTDGIRGTVGTSPITSDDFVRLGKAIGTWIQNNSSLKTLSIVIGCDPRISAPLLTSCLVTGLLHNKISILNAGIVPTPLIFHHTMNKFDFGIMITASHNPYHDNGIKIFKHGVGKISLKDELYISELFHKNRFSFSYENRGQNECFSDAYSHYFYSLFSSCSIKLNGIKLVIDCAQGATAQRFPSFLKECGAEIIEIASEPDGKNINHTCGALHPEKLQKAVLKHKAHAGFAFDGDGDRLCLVAQDGTIKDGDDILAFLLTYHPLYKKEQSIVGTIMSNQGLEAYVKRLGKTFYRTDVGDKHVLEQMKKCRSNIGAEPSGHIILRDFLDTADGLFALFRLVETAQLLDDWSFTTFTKFPNQMFNVPVSLKKDLSLQPFADIINEQKEKLLPGRLVVRYSGTEPLLRIMVEAPTAEQAHIIGKKLSQKLATALNQ